LGFQEITTSVTILTISFRAQRLEDTFFFENPKKRDFLRFFEAAF